MKFWAKVRFKGERNAEHLIRAFFADFNPESSIVIRGKEAKIEGVFSNTPPTELIEAVNHCEVVEFNFGKALEEYSEEENAHFVEEEEISEQTEKESAEEKNLEQAEHTEMDKEILQQIEPLEKKRGIIATKSAENAEKAKIAKAEKVSIPYLEEFAKKATSFNHFVNLVAEWLEMGKRQEFFEALVTVGIEVEKISWKELENALKNKAVNYTQWDKIHTGQQVSKKLKEYSVTMLTFLNEMVLYKDYPFGHAQSDKIFVEQVTAENANVAEYENSDITEESISKKRAKMACMPEIAYFEEVLGSIDKTQPVENRVRYVLTAMGWNNTDEQDQQKIFSIANAAVRIEEMDFDTIFSKANIPVYSSMDARMTFSKFLNDFISKYDSDKKVKLLDFLKQLQEIVMCEGEIQESTEFND